MAITLVGIGACQELRLPLQFSVPLFRRSLRPGYGSSVSKLRPDSQPTQFCTGGVTDHFRPTEFAVVISHSKWYFGGTMSSTLLHPPSMEGFAMTFQREREREIWHCQCRRAVSRPRACSVKAYLWRPRCSSTFRLLSRGSHGHLNGGTALYDFLFLLESVNGILIKLELRNYIIL